MARSTWIRPVLFSSYDVFVDVALPATSGSSERFKDAEALV